MMPLRVTLELNDRSFIHNQIQGCVGARSADYSTCNLNVFKRNITDASPSTVVAHKSAGQCRIVLERYVTEVDPRDVAVTTALVGDF